MRKPRTYCTTEYFLELTKNMKRHPDYPALWIDKNGTKLIEIISADADMMTLQIKEPKPNKSINNAGYVLVSTSKYGTKSLHRLVAETWLPRVRGKNEVNHIDHDKTNNKVENLEWVTRSENMRDAWRSGCISNPSYKGRWINGILHTKDKDIEMNYSDYLKWRESNGLPVYARMRRKEILK